MHALGKEQALSVPGPRTRAGGARLAPDPGRPRCAAGRERHPGPNRRYATRAQRAKTQCGFGGVGYTRASPPRPRRARARAGGRIHGDSEAEHEGLSGPGSDLGDRRGHLSRAIGAFRNWIKRPQPTPLVMRKQSPRNRTLACTDEEIARLSPRVLRVDTTVSPGDLESRFVAGDIFEVAKHFPPEFVDLLILDPPYNLSRNFYGNLFRTKERGEYQSWFRDVVDLLIPMMKPDATIHVCSDWRTSTLVFPILESKFHVRNRITWEREKGRGAKRNWKNNTEDIWFCTKSSKHHFDVESRQTETQGSCALPDRRGSEGLAPGEGRQLSPDPSVERLGRFDDPVLVHAGKHRPSCSETREAGRKNDTGELEEGRLRVRSLCRQRHHGGRS